MGKHPLPYKTHGKALAEEIVRENAKSLGGWDTFESMLAQGYYNAQHRKLQNIKKDIAQELMKEDPEFKARVNAKLNAEVHSTKKSA